MTRTSAAANAAEKCPICTDDSPDFKKDLGPHHQHSAHCDASSSLFIPAKDDPPLTSMNKGKYSPCNASTSNQIQIGPKRVSASRLTNGSGSSLDSFGKSPELSKYRAGSSYKDDFKVHLLSPEVRKYRKGGNTGLGATNRTNSFGQNFPLKVLGTSNDLRDTREARLKDKNTMDSYSAF